MNFRRHFFKKRCEVVCSSRTDARVHALQSTFHVDVPHAVENASLCDEKKSEIIANLNGNLNILRAAIRINDIEIVDKTNFEAYRNVAKRSYMYRIAIKPTGKIGEFDIPIEEVDRCFVIEYVEMKKKIGKHKINKTINSRSNTFDVEKFQRAAQMFIGKHDFRSFMKYSKEEKTVNIRLEFAVTT